MAEQRKPIDFTSILVVDDNLTLLRETAFLLKVVGFQVATAETTAQALDLLRHHSFDLMIVDDDMADSDRLVGAEQRRSAIPFILTSARYALDDLLRALDRGAAEFIPKPYAIYDLLDAIKEIVQPHPVNSVFRQVAG